MHDNRKRAILFMSVSSMFFALVATCVKLAGDIPTIEKVLFRNVVMLILTSGVLLGMKKNPFKVPYIPRMILRSIFGLIGVITFFYTVNKLPLADASMLNKLSPFFVAIFAAIFLSEKFHKHMIAVLLIAFAGMALIVKPNLNVLNVPALIGVGSAVFAAAAYTTVRSLQGKAHPFVIVFYFALVSNIAISPFVIGKFVMPDGIQWLWLIGTGVFAVGGQFTLTYAYHHAPASEISIYIYLNIVFALFIDILVFNTSPDILSIIGGVLIFVAAFYNRNRLLKLAKAKNT